MHIDFIGVDGPNFEQEYWKLDVVIRDWTGTGLVTLCQVDIRIMEEGVSYQLRQFVIGKYASKRESTMTKDGSVEAAIYDIDYVGPQLDSYRSSLVCKARVELCTPPLEE